MIVVPTKDIVSLNEWRKFWISYDYDAGKIQVGRAGEYAFMNATDTNPVAVQYLGYRSHYNEVKYRFCFD